MTQGLKTTTVKMTLHLFWGESMIGDGIACHWCPRKHEVCHLVTSISVDWLHASGGLNNILWPGCSQVSDAEVISCLRPKVCLPQEAWYCRNLCIKAELTTALSQTHSPLLWCSHTWSSSKGFCCTTPPGHEGVLKKVLIFLCTAVLFLCRLALWSTHQNLLVRLTAKTWVHLHPEQFPQGFSMFCTLSVTL